MRYDDFFAGIAFGFLLTFTWQAGKEHMFKPEPPHSKYALTTDMSVTCYLINGHGLICSTPHNLIVPEEKISEVELAAVQDP